MNQWKNEKEAIDWFKSVKQKQLGKFVIFDISSFMTEAPIISK